MPRVSDEYLARRRVEILSAASRCFARDGFHATSMDNIVAECGLSAGAVYRYFNSKDELIAAVIDSNLSTADELFADLLADDAIPSPAYTVTVVIDAIIDRGTHHPVTGIDTTRIAIQVWAESLCDPATAARTQQTFRRFAQHYAEVARRWQAAGHLPADADPTHVGAVLLGIVHAFIIQRHLLPGTNPERYRAAVHALLTAREGPAHRPIGSPDVPGTDIS
jgi:AcrR family transcriptional regulator